MKTIVLGADHAGFKLKEKLKKHLKQKYRVVDEGALKCKPNDDYPDYAFKVGKRIVKHNEIGILVCGSSEGVCIAANKVKGVRAVTAMTIKTVKLAREHNEANILCLSGWLTKPEKAIRLVDVFLSTSFSGEKRHKRRIKKIEKYEK